MYKDILEVNFKNCLSISKVQDIFVQYNIYRRESSCLLVNVFGALVRREIIFIQRLTD